MALLDQCAQNIQQGSLRTVLVLRESRLQPASWLPALFGASQSSTNVAAVSQWSLWHADDSLPEATGASQSNDDLSAQDVL